MITDPLSFVVESISCLSGLATVAAVLLGIRVYRRQMNAQLFLAFTQRYESIMSVLPDDARYPREDGSAFLPAHLPGVYAVVLRYLNLCSEEYYLCKTGHLEKSLWSIWEEELKRTVRTLVRPEWPELRAEFESYPEFRDYIDTILKEATDGTGPPVTLPQGHFAPSTRDAARNTRSTPKT